MKLLALDTAMAACSVAIIDTDHVLPLADAWVAMERGHAEALAPMIKSAMVQSGLEFCDLNRIAVTIGPGTFTGVRIGLAMARGLGLALGIPVFGIDTLSAIAANIPSGDTAILVAADAHKDEVYAALLGGDGKVLRRPAVVPVATAALELPDDAVVIGTGADLILTASGRGGKLRSKAGDLPVAAHFGAVCVQPPDPLAMPEPLYLRAPDAKPQVIPQRAHAAFMFQTLTRADAELLAALHGECFDTPWSADDFRQLLTIPGTTALVTVDRGEPIAFALFRRAADEVEIITIGTRPFAQRRGAARALINRQFTELFDSGILTCFIEVAESNSAAQGLYSALGFARAGTRSNYYERPGGLREDAIVMRKVLAP